MARSFQAQTCGYSIVCRYMILYISQVPPCNSPTAMGHVVEALCKGVRKLPGRAASEALVMMLCVCQEAKHSRLRAGSSTNPPMFDDR